MILQNITLYKYDLPLKRPLYVAGKEVARRQGLLLCISDSAGKQGYGDIAPLTGLSKEPFEEVLEQAKSVCRQLKVQELPGELEKLDGSFNEWMGEWQLAASVRFGIELAILNLLADQRGTPLAKLCNETVYEDITVNGLLYGNKQEVIRQADELIGAGFKSLKLKVGADIDEAIAKVQAVSEHIRGRAVLHLDANRAWDINKAVHFGHEVGLTTVDYIEEPFAEIKQAPDFFMKTTIPVAADESLLNHSIKELKAIDGLEVLILKPTLLGGIERTAQLIKEARKWGLSPVVSSCYESSVGILGLANIAGFALCHQGAGLDTLKMFEKDVITAPVPIEHGKIDITAQRIHESDLNRNILEEIPL